MEGDREHCSDGGCEPVDDGETSGRIKGLKWLYSLVFKHEHINIGERRPS